MAHYGKLKESFWERNQVIIGLCVLLFIIYGLPNIWYWRQYIFDDVIGKRLVKTVVENDLQERFPNMDYYISYIGREPKASTDEYTSFCVEVRSNISRDSYFKMYYNRTKKGTIYYCSDTYLTSVVNKGNTLDYYRRAYKELIQEILAEFKWDCSIQNVDFWVKDHGQLYAEDGFDLDLLELDAEYDNNLVATYGIIDIRIKVKEAITEELITKCLTEIDSKFQEKGIKYHSINFTISDGSLFTEVNYPV